MDLLSKKTNELEEQEKKELCALFENVFSKKMDLTDFKNKFEKNCKCYSYHSMLINEDNKIVGCYSCIPYEYNYFGNKLLFGLSVDTMIQEEYRGSPFTLKKIANAVYDEMKKDGVSFVFGFPNDNVYLVRKKILKWKDIGELKYYILPINIGTIKSRFKYLDFASKLYANIVNKLVVNEFKSIGSLYNIEKENIKEFRYDSSYKVMSFEDGYISYKTYDEEGVKVAYLIDLYPLNKQNIEYAVKEIYNSNKNDIDMIMYVGYLDFKLKNLIELPKKLEPKTVHMSGKIIDAKKVDNKIFDIKNWNVNLSNYDVR